MDLDIEFEEMISLANALLDHAVVPRHITTIKQCNSTLFSHLYESLTGSRVPGIISQAPTSEAVKCQAVVNALNRHLAPHVNLDHIRGIDIAALDLLALKNLLDIFAVLFHLPRTFDSRYDDELEGSETEQNGECEEEAMNDSNLISTEGQSVIFEVLHEELRRGHKQESTDTDSTTELLRPVPSARLPSRVAQMTALQDNNQGLGAERHSSSHTTNSSEQPPSLSVSNIHTTATDISSSSSHEARRMISQVGEPTDRRGTVSVPSDAVAAVSTSTQPHTPPQSPHHQRHLLKSPLHHSTPHTSTRSRVFCDQNVPTLSPAQMPTLRTMFEPSQGTTAITETHPVPSTAPASDIRSNVPLPDNSTLLRTEESTVLPESTPSEVPNLTITDLHTTTTLQDTTNMSQQETPQNSRSNVVTASTERRGASSNSSMTEHSDETEDADSLIDRSRLSRLDARAAQTRAAVLAAIYKNYLSELKAAQPHKVTSKIKHTKTHGRKKHSKTHHSRAPPSPFGASRDKRDRDSEQTKTPTKLSVGDNLMPLIERDFPFIHVSPSTMHRLMERQIQQVKALTSSTQNSHNTSTVKKINEMELRYRTLLQVIKKELEHTKRMQRQHEQQQEKKKVKSSVSAKRQAAARSKRYFNEYELRLRAKMQRRRTREEGVFKKAFEEGLELQRERVRELRRYTREKQEEYAKCHRDQLESMENYYRDQFAMLVESTAREREETIVRERAQHQVVGRMKHELRQKIEDEIKQLQESIDREEDVIHFRELDSENLRHKLSRLTFTAAVK